MKNLIVIIICAGILFPAEFTLAPIVYVNYESSSGIWKVEDEPIGVGGWGLAAIGNINNLTIELDAYNNRFVGIKNKPNDFSHEQGISWEGHDPGGNQFDFDITNLKLSYKYKNVVFEFGKFNRHWGPGNSSLSISKKPPSFPQFGFIYDITPSISFEYFHGSLRSLIPDETNAEYYEGIGIEEPELNRFIAAHRINWSITDRLAIGASELVVYGVREMDLIYLLPFAPFLSLQQYAGDLDNIQWVLDIDWKVTNKVNLYSSFLMDEWTPSMTFDKPNRNWFAYQVGTKANNLFINNDRFILEHSWSDHRVYRHQNEINDYYSHGYPLGFWAGPHAQEIFIKYMFSKFNLDISISYSHSKRGELTSSMLEGQYDNIHYERFSNISEELSVCKILIFKEVKKGFNLHFGVSNIDWKNGNFNPNPSEFEINDLVDISKFSFTLGFSQNFDIFNQTSKITDNSIKKIITF